MNLFFFQFIEIQWNFFSLHELYLYKGLLMKIIKIIVFLMVKKLGKIFSEW